MTTNGTNGLEHDIAWVALELGVDRQTLKRRLLAYGIRKKRITTAEGFAAYTADSDSGDARRRKHMAEAEIAELDAAQKRGELMMKKDGELLWADLTIKQRTLISSKQEWKSEPLLKELSKIRIDK